MKTNTIENANEALSIVDKVCKKYIPKTKFQLEVVEEDETVLVLSFPTLNAAIGWDLDDDALDETILLLEAHGVCGAVLRHEASESVDSLSKVFKRLTTNNKRRICRFN